MKILLVSPFDFSHPGGVNEHVSQLDRQFQRLGHSTRIIAATSLEVGEMDDGHVYRLGTSVPLWSNGSKARITLSPLVTIKVRQFLNEEQFDVIHLHEPLAPMVPLAVLLHSKTVNVGTFHAARPSNVWYMYTKAILDLFFEKLDARIAVSEPAREFVDSYFPAEFDIIPNGISLEQYHPDVEPFPQYMDGRPNILFVGRYNEQRKGFRYLARAFAMIRSQFSDARLIVVGQGDPERYQRFFDGCGIGPDDAVFVGFAPSHDLPRYYASCHVFCAPSTGRESFGVILLEALASGKPVVATSIAGYQGVIRNGIDGVLVEPKDPQSLALAIVRVLADADYRERLIRNGLEHVRQFEWPVVAERVMGVYERAIAESAAGPMERSWPIEITGRRG